MSLRVGVPQRWEARREISKHVADRLGISTLWHRNDCDRSLHDYFVIGVSGPPRPFGDFYSTGQYLEHPEILIGAFPMLERNL